MKEISNSTLALFVVTAIVVSVFGTLMSVQKLDDLGGVAGITGMLSTSSTQTGTANLTVEATTFINLSDNLIELGNLKINEYNTSDDRNDWWTVRNDGSVNISIRAYSTSGDDQDRKGAGTATNGSGPFVSTNTGSGCLSTGATSQLEACFMVKCHNTTSLNTTEGNSYCNSTYEGLLTNAHGPTGRILMDRLQPDPDGEDTALFGVNVTVPIDELAGNKEQAVEFLASQSS